MIKVGEVYRFIDSIAPYSRQCDWDNSGLNIGSFDDETQSVTLALDCTRGVVDAAVKNGSRLVVTHHPLIFSPLKSIESDSVVAYAIKNNISVLSAHTNYDMADGGVNDVLCDILGMANAEKLFVGGQPIMRCGFIGACDLGKSEGVAAGDFARFAAAVLSNAVKFFDSGSKVRRAAVCSGAGGEYVREAKDAGCDTLITGEAKHHEFLAARELGVNLISAGHYATEFPAVKALAGRLSEAFGNENICVSPQKNPYETVI